MRWLRRRIVEVIEPELDGLRERIARLGMELATLRGRVDELSREIQELRALITERREARHGCRRRIEELEARLIELENELRRMRGDATQR